jgi:hypothetical protein
VAFNLLASSKTPSTQIVHTTEYPDTIAPLYNIVPLKSIIRDSQTCLFVLIVVAIAHAPCASSVLFTTLTNVKAENTACTHHADTSHLPNQCV